MKKISLFVSSLLCLISYGVSAQNETVIPPSNRSTTSLEKNLLFFADTKFTVSQSGSASIFLPVLFNGNLQPAYTGAINPANPLVILIENLPDLHVQAGGWIGWTTRYYLPVKFKIEVYNISGGANTWVTLANETAYTNGSFIGACPPSSVSKIRFTFYEGQGPSGAIGLSELFFIHPEATTAYDDLMVKYNSAGNVGIGTVSPDANYKLSVNGKIRAKEIKVETNWADFVFAKDYKLPTLQETEKHIKEKGHLPGIPTDAEVAKDGIELGGMNKKLLQKIEELTLYMIEQNKRIMELENKSRENNK